MTGKFEIYRDKSGKFRWRLATVTGRVIARSGGSYPTKLHAMKGVGGALSVINTR
jgi:uncharacterized protein YegP (UPF0339 family)